MIARFIKPVSSVHGVVAIGSVATGNARKSSDIDAILFMDPVDRYILPAESIWCPWDDSFHSIFVDDQRIQREGIPLDLYFRDVVEWSSESFEWPEFDRAGLAEGWIAFDRHGQIAPLIEAQTLFDDATRLARLDAFLLTIDNNLGHDTAENNWSRYGAFTAFSRLNAVYDGLVSGLFAYNRRWRFYPERETMFMRRLPWLPEDYERRMLLAMNSASLDKDGYVTRANMLRELSNEIITKLQLKGIYGENPVSEAFIRTHDEPGRAWNMQEWNQKRKQPGGSG
ncbi:MAG: nucleotidyltransferase domain-containing protein [Chloroflexi bacterium]|nr:nucleotidyltransferase domain-containing protein [Chloroflexota bacterium]